MRLRKITIGSRLERRFIQFWTCLGGPPLEREFMFHGERKWRADFAHLPTRLLLEIEGGIYLSGGGRHNRAAGFIADSEKYLEAVLADWTVVRLCEPQITAPTIERLIAWVRNRSL